MQYQNNVPDMEIQYFTKTLQDGRTAVLARNANNASVLRPLPLPYVFDDAAVAVAHALVLDNTAALTLFASRGQPFLDNLVRQIRARGITSYPCEVSPA